MVLIVKNKSGNDASANVSVYWRKQCCWDQGSSRKSSVTTNKENQDTEGKSIS